jgi:rhodanese-related sulfurtransferase
VVVINKNKMHNNCCIKLSEALKTGLHQFLLLDIRNQSQFSNRHLPGAVNIPFEWLRENLSAISVNSNIILIGEKNPEKTELAKQFLYKNGITKVATLCGGIKAWSTEIQFC